MNRQQTFLNINSYLNKKDNGGITTQKREDNDNYLKLIRKYFREIEEKIYFEPKQFQHDKNSEVINALECLENNDPIYAFILGIIYLVLYNGQKSEKYFEKVLNFYCEKNNFDDRIRINAEKFLVYTRRVLEYKKDINNPSLSKRFDQFKFLYIKGMYDRTYKYNEGYLKQNRHLTIFNSFYDIFENSFNPITYDTVTTRFFSNFKNLFIKINENYKYYIFTMHGSDDFLEIAFSGGLRQLKKNKFTKLINKYLPKYDSDEKTGIFLSCSGVNLKNINVFDYIIVNNDSTNFSDQSPFLFAFLNASLVFKDIGEKFDIAIAFTALFSSGTEQIELIKIK